MPASIFLLGPDHWDDGVQVDWPAWAARQEGHFTPKRLRQEMARLIVEESEGRVKAVVMDNSHKPYPEANDATTFHHIETRFGVDAYFIILPDRTKVLGTVFEGGMLTRDFQFGRNPRVALFMEETFANEDDNGDFGWAKGKRTRYLNTVVDIAEHVQTWRNMEQAVEQVIEWALE